MYLPMYAVQYYYCICSNMLFCVFQNSTNITYAELGEFQKEKMPFPPLPLTSVVYASISKQQRLSIQNTKVQHNSIALHNYSDIIFL